MSSLTLASLLAQAAAGATIGLYPGTDLASATDIQQNGLSVAKAKAAGGTGEFWATDVAIDAEFFARVSPRPGTTARLEFEVSAGTIVQLLSTVPPRARLHQGFGLEFFGAAFSVLNQRMQKIQVILLP